MGAQDRDRSDQQRANQIRFHSRDAAEGVGTAADTAEEEAADTLLEIAGTETEEAAARAQRARIRA